MIRARDLVLISGAVGALSMLGCGSSEAGGGGGSKVSAGCPDSTYGAIQQAIFEAKGCTASACHGESAQGDLDLRAGTSHGALVHAASSIDVNILRVQPGDQDRSLLYRKLEAKIEGADLGALGQAMPVNTDPLTDDELEALRLWIRGGASPDAVDAEVMALLDCEGTFNSDPDNMDPPPAPPAGKGVQIYAGGWHLPAESEDEVCFVTYYDFSADLPEDTLVSCPDFGGQQCFAFARNELWQDAQSHHSVINAYWWPSDPNDPAWGTWTCLGGDKDGEVCDPVGSSCGEASQCATPVLTSEACNAYPRAPEPFHTVTGSRVQLTVAQESTYINDPIPGVYQVLPVRGFVVWNSHAFNLTTTDTSIDQWVNLIFAPESEREWRRVGIFNTSRIYSMTPVAPFEKKEVCMTFTLPQYSKLLSLSSHMHGRGELFRIWTPPNEPCAGAPIGCSVPSADPEYENRLYDDPVYKYYDTPLAYDGAAVADRTFKSCAVYDNGKDDPAQVKRHSTRPIAPTCELDSAYCGCSAAERVCFGGDDQGSPCNGDDAGCSGGGVCDACPLIGGITTDDEMFITLGSYYVDPP